MKKTLHILGIAILLVGLVVTFTACQSKTADSHLASAPDTTKTKVVYKPFPAAVPSRVAQPAKKKGWSSAAKGTVIGTTTGAIAGALINKKNRVVGGIIGGLLGGGAGYGIGHGIDKKNDR